MEDDEAKAKKDVVRDLMCVKKITSRDDNAIQDFGVHFETITQFKISTDEQCSDHQENTRTTKTTSQS